MSKKSKWKESFQKARSISQTSLGSSNSFVMDLPRTSSVMNEETTDQELNDYIRAIKQKSGLKNLWSGDKFLKAVRDEEEKTPDISISSEEGIDEELMSKSFSDDGVDDDDDDFKPKLMMLSQSSSPEEDHDTTESSINPFQGIQLQLDDLDLNKVDLNNNEYKVAVSDSNIVSETNEIKSINNDLSAVVESEVETEDIIDEIEQDTTIASDKNDENEQRNETPINYNYSSFKSDQGNDTSVSERTFTKTSSQSRKSSKTRSFSESERTDSQFHKRKSKHSRSYKKHKEINSNSSQTSENSSSWKSSRNKHRLREYQTSECNRLTREVGVQTYHPNSSSVPSGLGIGMATSSPALGMQYVDPSPIATHAVASEALEAITAYNPAIIALNDMLRQQIQLVDQFVESNRRMYEAYTRNISTNHQYTTLEDTLQYIKQNRPSVITMEEALEAIKRDEE